MSIITSIKYGSYICTWAFVNKSVRFIFKNQNKEWISNIVSFLNATTFSFGVIYDISNGLRLRDPFYYYSIIGYYIYDIKNYKIFSTFWIHHVFSSIMMYIGQIQDNEYSEIIKKILVLFEISNFPIYFVYGMLSSKNKAKWKESKILRNLMIFEFIWYSFFRLIMPLRFYLQLKYPHIFCLAFFQYFSFIWAKGMYKNIYKCKIKQP